MNSFMEPNGACAISGLPDNALLKLKTVLALVQMGKSSWYAGIKQGIYPKQVKTGTKMSRWIVGDIKAYLNSVRPQANSPIINKDMK